VGVDRIDAPNLRRVHARLESDPAMRRAWDAASSAWPSNPNVMWEMWGAANWRIPWCAQTELGAGFERCAGIEDRANLLRGAPIAAVAALAILGGLILAARRRRRVSKLR